jgi:hypothetical protein
MVPAGALSDDWLIEASGLHFSFAGIKKKSSSAIFSLRILLPGSYACRKTRAE